MIQDQLRRYKKPALAVLASLWFIPLSCAVATYAGVHLFARLDERIVERGDEIHGFFLVAMAPGENGEPFKLVDLDKAVEIGPNETFLMPQPEGRKDVRETRLSYRVLEDHGMSQIIEIEETDDDKTMWSRYRAAKTNVAPISSRAWYFGYLFAAFPFAFLFALVVYLAAGLLKRRNRG